MHREGILSPNVHPAEILRPLEERRSASGAATFVSARRYGSSFGCTLALLVMMVREEDPIHLPNTNFTQVIKNASVAGIDQQSRVAIAQDVYNADVGPDEEIRMALLAGLAEASGYHLQTGHRPDKAEQQQASKAATPQWRPHRFAS